MSLRHSYTLLAPLYDHLVEPASGAMRRDSLAQLSPQAQHILLVGVGSGLDFPYLPPQRQYWGLDLTPAMLKRAEQRARQQSLPITLQTGDAQALPYADQSFDAVILHLILAVVPDGLAVLRETARVLRPGGQVLIVDKFLRPGQRAPLRRLLNLLLQHVASRTDVVFEPLLAQVPSLQLCSDQALIGGWFRRIVLEKSL